MLRIMSLILVSTGDTIVIAFVDTTYSYCGHKISKNGGRVHLHLAFTRISPPLSENQRTAPSLTPCRGATGTLQTQVQSRIQGTPAQQEEIPKNRMEFAQGVQCKREHAPNMAMMQRERAHMVPFSTWHPVLNPLSVYYISRDHPSAHELTNHIRHPSPAPGLRLPGAPGKTFKLRRWNGIVPVSPTGTTRSLSRILWMGITLKMGFLQSSSCTVTIREPTDFNQPATYK